MDTLDEIEGVYEIKAENEYQFEICDFDWLIRVAKAARAALPLVNGENKYKSLRDALEHSR